MRVWDLLLLQWRRGEFYSVKRGHGFVLCSVAFKIIGGHGRRDSFTYELLNTVKVTSFSCFYHRTFSKSFLPADIVAGLIFPLF